MRASGITTLCDACKRADTWCPAWPLETTDCVEFQCRPSAELRNAACLLIAGGLRAAHKAEDEQRHWALMCRTIESGV